MKYALIVFVSLNKLDHFKAKFDTKVSLIDQAGYTFDYGDGIKRTWYACLYEVFSGKAITRNYNPSYFESVDECRRLLNNLPIKTESATGTEEKAMRALCQKLTLENREKHIKEVLGLS